jgi:hypothetical protein
VVSKFQFACFECAVLTLYLHVCFSLVIFLVSLGDDHAALTTFVIDARALDFVHPELRQLDVALAVFAQFRLFSFYHLNY